VTAKKAKKRFARDVQALTGRSFLSAMNLLNTWTKEGINWNDGIASLSRGANVVEDADDASRKE
jgi:hypothetical protein